LKVAARGGAVELPDTASVLPFLDLYTLVTLKPERLDKCVILTPYEPDLWILKDGQFCLSHTTGAKDVLRIYDTLAIPNRSNRSQIPLSPAHPDFATQHYWRLHMEPDVMLAMFLERIRLIVTMRFGMRMPFT
jgi:hypothetical protein